jgi:hypothetical protein
MSQTIDLFNDERPPQMISIFNDENNIAIWAKKGFFPKKPNPLIPKVEVSPAAQEIKLDSSITEVEKVNNDTLQPEPSGHSLGKKGSFKKKR